MIRHYASSEFWYHYRRLPSDTRRIADAKFQILQLHPENQSLSLRIVESTKTIKMLSRRNIWVANVSLNIRALAREYKDGLLWYWVGDHDRYETKLR